MESIKNQPVSEAKMSAEEEILQDVRPYDILCGRSKTCFNNIGNRRFRITISMNVKQYDTITNRTERGKFINNLSRTLKEDAGFRFFRISKKDGRVELSEKEIQAKIGHALRDLSKAQAETAAAGALPIRTKEAQKIIESATITKTPLKEMIPTSKPPAPVVTPEPLPRRVTNDFETDSNGRLLALPICPDIRKEAMMDMDDGTTSDEVPHSIFFSSSQQQEDMHPIVEEASEPSKIVSGARDNELRKPAPATTPALVHRTDDHIGDDEHVLFPLRFDQPADDSNDMLDPIPLDVLPDFVDVKMAPKVRSVGARSVSMPNIHFNNKSPLFAMDDDEDDEDDDLGSDEDDDLGSITSVPYNDEEVPTANQFDGVPYHRKPRSAFSNHHADVMSMGSSSDDEHMISLCESIDCLSFDLNDTIQA